MKTLELFCGTKSFSKVMLKHGHSIFTIDHDPIFKPDRIQDLSKITDEEIENLVLEFDIIWLSPPCQTFSLASGNRHWTADRKPRTHQAIKGRELLFICKRIADACIAHNKIFFIENPRARARWFLPDTWRKTAWYCQYGDKRAKPTDIWTNLGSWIPKTCKNGNQDCHHEKAPRGSKSGTQGQSCAKTRGVIPEALFEEILNIIENEKDNQI